MQVFTPVEIAKHAANKYLGVLVAAKYARVMNENQLFRERGGKKLTTTALEDLASGALDDKYRVVPRPRSA
jgi:DNA-directed RNA polymerase omega subunit